MRLSLLALFLCAGTLPAADWKLAPTPLMTKWGKQITPEKTPWAEYPRPQLVRKDWLNLNGLWDYAITKKGEAKPSAWDGKILVPFCIESALSGVGKHPTPAQELWYRRDLDASAWKGQRVLLHFGAVDWETTAYVNGKEVGTHKGGFDPFSFDITDALKDGKGELVLKVWDPTDKGSQPVGKQIENPHGIWYTPVSGIWQTVWMEPVPNPGPGPLYVKRVQFIPDIDKGEVEVLVEINSDALPVTAEVTITGAGTQSVQAGKAARVKVPNAKLWTPDAPHLYPVTISLTREHRAQMMREAGETVSSYFAMRKVSAGPDENGTLRLLLNNKPLFQVGPLDQGWWPDGLLTPPSEEAMRYDLEMLKKMGMNMVRKHIKIEPARYYYDCDRMGFVVWQDMPSAINRTKKHFIPPGAKQDADDQFTDTEKKQFNLELKAMIDHLKFFPCIYCWVPFNEGWGQHDTNAILKWTKEYDPTRLVNGPSGWEDRGYGDMKDAHIYPGPGMFPIMKDRVSVLGEFGGLGLPVKDHLWKDQGNWGYRTYKTEEELRTNYHGLMTRLHPLIGKGLSAAVYTQTTDVEVEVNGFMTYDREVMKFDVADMAKWHKTLFGPAPEVKELVPTSETTGQTWKYRTDAPPEGWAKADFDAATWSEGKGGFGSKGTPGSIIGTEWTGKNIWLRRTFELKDLPAGELMVRFHCDEDGEVYVNGVLAASLPGYTTGYTEVPLSAAAVKALKAGPNTLAVKAKNAGGGQYIDVGLVEQIPAKK
ncbi:glycoside hydrolase family 2 protein [Limnoglobus roseus]|uniref:GH2 + CBM35_pectate_lyase-like-retaining glycoside hydrolase n=1 Tax=Limnoglobus roseus TaxID=2598579 RepID=A0A5C1AH38_9BACT|nr:sugar-binding domain-containing protein [Limnoglobus roseus]QEL17306.1 GH2 + CBM35_pectate_lyase-like - retaining glycoside hydrolase [Limnoglobus roseus]